MDTLYGSDVIASLLAEAGIDYVALNPGASFRGIHDSLVHRTGGPALILCLHEGIAVAVAHGYARACGRPMGVLLHNVVGLQHGSMAIYNAWCDRVPMLVLGGTGPMSKVERRPWIDWIHTAAAQAEQVRDYVKWDDQPADLASVPESFARAWLTAQAAPPGPVYLCFDVGVQEQEAPGDFEWRPLAEYSVPTPPAASRDDVAWIAERLVQAKLPVLVSDYAGATDAGFETLRELAELLHAPVVDGGARLAFPTQHELSFAGLERELQDADLVLALDVEDLPGLLAAMPPGAAVINVSPAHLRLRSWSHDYQELVRSERHVSGSCESVLPALVAACREHASLAERSADRRRRLDGVRGRYAAGWRDEAARAEADGAVPPARLAFEIGTFFEGGRWTLTHGSLGGWERRLWRFERRGQHLAFRGGGGLGYGLGASIGAALAQPADTLSVNIQPDGDLLYLPSALWTAARYRTPLLTIMNNNRQYENTVGHAQHIALARSRSAEKRHEGSGITDPEVDFAALARSMGVWAIGPISRPEDVVPALEEARAVVASGRPALVDVVTTGT